MCVPFAKQIGVLELPPDCAELPPDCTVLTLIVTVLLASLPSALKLPAASENLLLATLIDAVVVLLGVGVKVAV